MARSKKSKGADSSNSLAIALEEGKSITGLVGYVPIEYCSDSNSDTIYVKVKCVGLKSEGCGIKVIAELAEGSGTIFISPCQFIDSPKEVESQRDRKQRFDLAIKEHGDIGKPYYAHTKKTKLLEYINENLSPEQQQEFWTALEDETGNKTLGKLAASEVRKYAAIAVCVKNGITGEDPSQFNRYSWF